jgi:CHAT domain-containing protein
MQQPQSWWKITPQNKLIEWIDEVSPKLSQQRTLQLMLEDRRDWLDTLDNRELPYSDPYYWAAFTISGR